MNRWDLKDESTVQPVTNASLFQLICQHAALQDFDLLNKI